MMLLGCLNPAMEVFRITAPLYCTYQAGIDLPDVLSRKGNHLSVEVTKL